jgi:cysteine desulfurase/selenocysteine lyase
MHRYGIPATSRASFAVYNTEDEIDKFIASVKKAIGVFS